VLVTEAIGDHPLREAAGVGVDCVNDFQPFEPSFGDRYATGFGESGVSPGVISSRICKRLQASARLTRQRRGRDSNPRESLRPLLA
jgi:hypothetical protein